MSTVKTSDLPYAPYRDVLMEAEKRGLKHCPKMGSSSVFIVGLCDIIVEMKDELNQCVKRRDITQGDVINNHG